MTEHFDLLIRGAVVFDGTGAPATIAEVGVRDGRIAAVGDLAGASAVELAEAEGLALAPGFIDAHAHDDAAVLDDPAMAPKVSQGVTTTVVGNCGTSLAPLDLDRDPPAPLTLLGGRKSFRFPRFADYRAEVEAHPPAVNVLALVGHTALRVATMDDLDRPARDGEIAAMQDLLAEALASGAAGLSTGLAYPPAKAAPTEEVIALCRTVAAAGALHTTHMRDETSGVVDSVEETIRIARETGVRTVISHHKCCGRENAGLVAETLPRIEAARRDLAIDLDVYPYAASSTALLPDFIARSNRVLVTWSDREPEAAGRDLADLMEERGWSVADALRELSPAGAVYFQMEEEDVERVLAFPPSLIGSDGLPHDQRPHPRLWGTFPRVLGHYARDRGLFSLEEAVHKMTGATAAVFGLSNRGAIRPGAAADLVLFDPERVLDAATYDHPARPAVGIERVWVAGRTVWDEDGATGERPGRFLARA